MRCAAAAALPLRFFDPKMIRWGGDHVEVKWRGRRSSVSTVSRMLNITVYSGATGHAVLLAMQSYLAC